jgi:ferredoxin
MKPDAMPGSGTPRFIVIGAGVGGICSALDLAEAGHPVTLVEQGPNTGGILPQLDHQFPDDHCGMCRMLPMVDRDRGEQTCLKRGLFHENIQVLTGTTLTGLKGRPGGYTAQLTRISPGIDSRRCSGCMACLDACPVEVPDAFNDRAGRRKAVYRPLFGNPEGLPTIDWESCTRCGACLAVCPNQAVDLEPKEAVFSLAPVPGVILAGGNRLYDPAVTDLYGYGVLPNVVTATAFERILSGTGPHGGRPVRPSDGKPIHRVGWIQCVGSRNVMIGSGHCSSVCCMMAVKEAMLVKRILGPHIDAAIFHMDMRTYGRDDQRYRDRAEDQAGVRFIRCRIHSVDPSDNPGDVKLTYLDAQNRPCEEVFDLVVLSTGAGVQPVPAPFFAEPADQGTVVTLGPEAGLRNIRETVVRAHGVVCSLLEKPSAARRDPGAGPAGVSTRRAKDRFKERPLIQIFLLENGAVKKPEVDWPEIESRLEPWAFPLPIQRLSVPEERDPWLDVAPLLESSAANRLLIVSTVVGGCREALVNGLLKPASAPSWWSGWI